MAAVYGVAIVKRGCEFITRPTPWPRPDLQMIRSVSVVQEREGAHRDEREASQRDARCGLRGLASFRPVTLVSSSGGRPTGRQSAGGAERGHL